MYAIGVSFCERGVFSKPYTYKSDVPYDRDSVVLVPAGKFYSVGKVTSCVEAAKHKFLDNVTYKFVVACVNPLLK